MKITPKMLASFVNGEVEGDGDVEITGFAKIEEAKPGDISFIANPKYAHFISTTNASVLLVSKDFNSEENYKDITLIKVDDPYSSLAELLTAFQQTKPEKSGIEQPCFVSEGVSILEKSYIGAFAYIGSGVRLGKGVKIFPQVYIGDNVVVGENTILYPGVKVYEGCKIGNRCVIHAGVVIGGDGFGFAPKNGKYEKIPQIGIVEIEDDVEIGSNTTIDRATFGKTQIGQGTKLDNLIQVAHNVVIGKDNVAAAQTGIAGSTKIGDHNMIGGQVGFAGHIVVGDNNEIGAQSGIPSNMGNGNRVIGYPAIDAHDFFRREIYLRQLGDIVKHYRKITK